MGAALGHLGAFCAKFRWAVLAVWLVLAVGLTALTGVLGPTTNNSVSLPGTESQAATDLLSQAFPPQQNGTSPAVYYAEKGKVDDGGTKHGAIPLSETHVQYLLRPFASAPLLYTIFSTSASVAVVDY